MNDIPSPNPLAASSSAGLSPRGASPDGRSSHDGHALAELGKAGARELGEAGVPTPEVDAELLLAHVLGIGRGELQAKLVMGAAATPEQETAYRSLLARRASREPLQHITGRAPFRSFELEVGPGVFVPRPETELTAQLAIDALLAVPAPVPRAVDLGTGSGALALALALEVPHAEVVAVERSEDAASWAERNIHRLAPERVRLVRGELGEALTELDGTIDVVVSNPPYIPDDAIPRDLEVRLHDPALALYGGPDGLDVVRALSRRALALLHHGGALVIEHGEEQGPSLRALLDADGWRATATHRDLLGRDRVTTAVR